MPVRGAGGFRSHSAAKPDFAAPTSWGRRAEGLCYGFRGGWKRAVLSCGIGSYECAIELGRGAVWLPDSPLQNACCLRAQHPGRSLRRAKCVESMGIRLRSHSLISTRLPRSRRRSRSSTGCWLRRGLRLEAICEPRLRFDPGVVWCCVGPSRSMPFTTRAVGSTARLSTCVPTTEALLKCGKQLRPSRLATCRMARSCCGCWL